MSEPDRVDELLKKQIERMEEIRGARRELPADEAAAWQPEYELEGFNIMQEIGRELTRDDLERLDVDAPGVVIEDKRYRRKGRSKATYRTLGGMVDPENRTRPEVMISEAK